MTNSDALTAYEQKNGSSDYLQLHIQHRDCFCSFNYTKIY
jgi:hypothetical protein